MGLKLAKIYTTSSKFASHCLFIKGFVLKVLASNLGFGPQISDTIYLSYKSYHEAFIQKSRQILPEVKWSLMEWKHGRAKNVSYVLIFLQLWKSWTCILLISGQKFTIQSCFYKDRSQKLIYNHYSNQKTPC